MVRSWRGDGWSAWGAVVVAAPGRPPPAWVGDFTPGMSAASGPGWSADPDPGFATRLETSIESTGERLGAESAGSPRRPSNLIRVMPAKGVVVSSDLSQSSAVPAATPVGGWATVEIVVTASLAVAFGVVFWAWNLFWAATGGAFAGLPPVQGLLYGVWLVPGVLAGLVVRRPGAAFFAAVLAAVVSALLGSQWGLVAVVYGVVQGAAPELVFALRGYRKPGLGTALLAAAATGLGSLGLDLLLYYPTWPTGWKSLYAVTLLTSAVLVAGIGSWLLAATLRASGALAALPASRTE